ncbi:MAG TPA: helix-turn-helix transcriptional regulator [Pseudorhodoferax sp.]|jgi:AraC-like DNA-binding protein|nr:helix-turn-helix transcriptional regulator [Pseudorhodoferax sp.]
MPSTVLRFDDFHLYGASAPEWRQCYRQISRGAMHSALLQRTLGPTQLFRKSLSQRVLQQGCLPAGRICFAMALHAHGPARMQGREFSAQRLFVLRGGEDFVIHRPAHMELLALTFDASDFDAFLAGQGDAAHLRATIGRGFAEVSEALLARLRGALPLLAWGAHARGRPEPAWTALAQAALMAAVVEVLRCGKAQPRRGRGVLSHVLVGECHRLTLASVHAPPSIEALCARLRTSRRTLQDSFRQVAETTPVDYLRAIRLNLVRDALHRSRTGELDIGEIAAHAGFSQLSHFAHRYRQLFGELPSQTLRAEMLATAAHACRPPAGGAG